MEVLSHIFKLIAYIVSGWTALCLLVDTLTILLSRDITALSWYACNPLCLWKFPALELGAFKGLFIWLIAIAITVLTAMFLI